MKKMRPQHPVPEVLRRFNTQRLIHIPKHSQLSDSSLGLWNWDDTQGTFLVFISTFKIFTDAVYSLTSPWKMYQTKQTRIPQLQNYIFVTMWMFTPRVYLEKHHLKKKSKNFWVFHWIFHKKWVAKNLRRDT